MSYLKHVESLKERKLKSMKNTKSTKSARDAKNKTIKSKPKITFRLYKIDRSLPREEIQDSLDLNTEDILPEVYKFISEAEENFINLDRLYDKHCNELSITDVVELQDKEGKSSFYFLDLFGFIEIEFDTSLVNKKTIEKE